MLMTFLYLEFRKSTTGMSAAKIEAKMTVYTVIGAVKVPYITLLLEPTTDIAQPSSFTTTTT